MSASARRTLFVEDQNSTSKTPLTPTPPSRYVPAALTGSALVAAAGGSAVATPRTAAGTTSPNTNRSSRQAYFEAKLETPIDLRANHYHTSQQATLNAELRAKVEQVTNEWERSVQTMRQQIEKLPEKSSTMNYMGYNGMTSYDEGYGCTEDLPMSEERLVSEFHLACTVDMLQQLQDQPNINVTSVGSSFDSLLNASRLLPNLEAFIKTISPLDIAADVDASAASVAMHEKYHYPVGEALRQELHRNIGPILGLEEKTLSEKTLKDTALENRDVAQAAQCLGRQVDFSNELLKLNATRMEVVQMIANEVQDFDLGTNKLLDTVAAIATTMEKNLLVVMEPIQRDLEDCKKDKELAKQQLAATAAAFAKEQADARMRFKEFEGKENQLLKQICDLFADLELTVSQKKHFVWERLLAKERNSRQQTIEAELLRAQEAHLLRLQICEDYVAAAQRSSQHFKAFSDSFDASLRARLQKHHDDLFHLQIHEASEYVRRFEAFSFCAEEVRAKKQTRLDAMNLSKRNLLLDIDAALATLDPDVKRYRETLVEIEQESGTLESYLGFLDEMQRERKAEVEPSTTLVSVFVAQNRQRTKSGLSSTAGRPNTGLRSASPLSSGRNTAGPISPRNASDIVRTVMSVSSAGNMSEALAERVTVEDGEIPENEGVEEEILHPQIAARQLGLIHEENVTMRAQDYVREELAAIEARMSDVRRAKTENMKRFDSARSTRSTNAPLIYIPN
jgi:hypothetical protein